MKACEDCQMVVREDAKTCPNCGSQSFSKDWQGYLVVLDPTKSDLAKKLRVKMPGKYALKVR